MKLDEKIHDIYDLWYTSMPLSVAARPKACVCGQSLAGIVGSNRAGCMDVCCECCVFCQVEVSATSWSLVQRISTDYSGFHVWSRNPSWTATLREKNIYMIHKHTNVMLNIVLKSGITKQVDWWTFVVVSTWIQLWQHRYTKEQINQYQTLIILMTFLNTCSILNRKCCYGAFNGPTLQTKTTMPTSQRSSLLQYSSSPYFVQFGPAKNPVELADGPNLYVTCQGQGICFVSSTNQLSLSLYNRLASGLPL
jgi:hypothetical protein